MKMDTASSKGLDDENPEIDRGMLPPIYNYGLSFVESLQEVNEMDLEEANGKEQEKNEEEEDMEEISEEELDFAHEPEEDSEDDEDSNRVVVIFFS